MMGSQLVEEKFSKFYENWMRQLEDHLELLLKVAQENNFEKEISVTTISKLKVHHEEFYKVKWANEDVLAFYAPSWLTHLENVYVWVTGWKPSMIFWLVESLKKTSLAGMTKEEVRKIEALRMNIKEQEDKVEREMERQHVRIAHQNIVELVQRECVAKRNSDSDLVEAALRGLMAGLKNVMKMADCVRLKALEDVLDVLNPIQCINFLVAMSTFQIQMRKWGKIRDNK